MNNPNLIFVEGGIGAGKTTMVKEIADITGWSVVPEPVENNPYLAPFYAEPEKYALPAQLWMQQMQSGALFSASQASQVDGKVYLLDRGLPGNWAFAFANWKMGRIKDSGWELYNEIMKSQWKVHTPASCIVHVDVSVPTLLQRIATRGRAMEAAIDTDYLSLLERGLDMAIKNYAEHFSVPVLRVSNEKWHSLENLHYEVGTGGNVVSTPSKALHEYIAPFLSVR